MERGKKFEQKVGSLFSELEARYPQWVKVFPQFLVELKSGRKVLIDFKLAIEFPHEFQNYYFELQSRNATGVNRDSGYSSTIFEFVAVELLPNSLLDN